MQQPQATSRPIRKHERKQIIVREALNERFKRHARRVKARHKVAL